MDDAPPDDLTKLPHWLTVTEYAAIMRITTKAAYAGIRDGSILSRRAGRWIRIPRSEVLPIGGAKRTARSG